MSARRLKRLLAFNLGGSKNDTTFKTCFHTSRGHRDRGNRLPTICANHKLVAAGDKHSVPLYADEATYQKASHQPEGVRAEQVADQTPVVIISSDDSGAIVEIVDGPMKGQNGFVSKDNVD